MANLKPLDASEINEGLECYYQSDSHSPIKGAIVYGNFQMIGWGGVVIEERLGLGFIGGGYYFSVESQSELGCLKINDSDSK